MIKNKINFNNKKRGIAVTGAAVTILLAVSIATIGAAPFSSQQASERTGPRITSANIVDGEVRNQDLASDSVTSDKIKDGEVTSADIADGTITSTDIAPGTIPSAGGGIPDDNSVTSAKIVDGEVKTEDLADNSVYSAKIQDGEVGESDLQDNAVTANKISNSAITSDKISSSLIKHVVLRYDSEGQNAGWRTGNARHIITDPDVHGTNSVVVANVIYPIDSFIGYHCFVTDLNEGSFRLDCNGDSPPGNVLNYLVINPP
jgi:hypothetical protein